MHTTEQAIFHMYSLNIECVLFLKILAIVTLCVIKFSLIVVRVAIVTLCKLIVTCIHYIAHRLQHSISYDWWH